MAAYLAETRCRVPFSYTLYLAIESKLALSPGLPLNPLPKNEIFWEHRKEGLGTRLFLNDLTFENVWLWMRCSF